MYVLRRSSLFVLCLAMLSLLSTDASAALVLIDGGSLTIRYDGSTFANVSSSYMGLNAAEGDFMRYGRYWAPAETVKGPGFTPKQPQEYRPLPITTSSGNPRQPNFRDNRALLDPLYPQVSPVEVLSVNGSGVVPNSAGSNRISTNLTFDTSNVLGSVSGLVQTNGVSAWWFANDSLMDSGVAWISWGDMSLRYDASRVSLGYSGWVFANQLGGVGDIFDTKNVSMTASTSGLVLSGELWGSDGTSADPYNENFATWETYTLMNPNLRVGTFEFSGVTAVPEPSSMVLICATALGGVALRVRGRRRLLRRLVSLKPKPD